MNPAQSKLLSEYWTPHELAAELGVCLETLKRWHRIGIGPPATKVGRRPYYRKAAVTAWLEAQENAA